MAEKGELPRISKSGGETQGVVNPWGDAAFHGPDIKPEEGRRLFKKDQLEKVKEAKKREQTIPPGNPDSIVPMNDEMIRQRKDGTYYRVKLDKVSSQS